MASLDPMRSLEQYLPGIDTPALVIDLDILSSNLLEMSRVAASHGVALRPHTKTHKMPAIAIRQLELGANGITCAKLGEAEVMADAGCNDILLAYPLVGAPKHRRLAALRERASVRVAIDSVEVGAELGRTGVASRTPIEVLVEVDTGHHRLGRPPGKPSADLVEQISRIKGLDVVGLITHAGHSYRSTSRPELEACAEREGTDLLRTAELCIARGIPIRVISVGSTPTARFVAGVAGVTEIRPGTYVFNDSTMIRLGVATPETVAARVLATVVARPTPDRVVFDAGTKCLSSDGSGVPDWIFISEQPDLHFEFLTEEHGVARLASQDHLENVRIGSRGAIVPSHICSVVNLFDHAITVRDGKPEAYWPVAARGAVR